VPLFVRSDDPAQGLPPAITSTHPANDRTPRTSPEKEIRGRTACATRAGALSHRSVYCTCSRLCVQGPRPGNRPARCQDEVRAWRGPQLVSVRPSDRDPLNDVAGDLPVVADCLRLGWRVYRRFEISKGDGVGECAYSRRSVDAVTCRSMTWPFSATQMGRASRRRRPTSRSMASGSRCGRGTAAGLCGGAGGRGGRRCRRRGGRGPGGPGSWLPRDDEGVIRARARVPSRAPGASLVTGRGEGRHPVLAAAGPRCAETRPPAPSRHERSPRSHVFARPRAGRGLRNLRLGRVRAASVDGVVHLSLASRERRAGRRRDARRSPAPRPGAAGEFGGRLASAAPGNYSPRSPRSGGASQGRPVDAVHR